MISCETHIRSEENRLGWEIEKAVEPLLVQVRERKVIKTDSCMQTEQYKKKEVEEREQRWMEKKIYGQFIKERVDDVDKEKMWTLLSSKRKVKANVLSQTNKFAIFRFQKVFYGKRVSSVSKCTM